MRYTRDGTLMNLAALARRGVNAQYLQPVDLTLPIPAYLTLSTGAFSYQTGLSSLTLHTLDVSSPAAHLGLAMTIAPEPIWRTAMRSGLKTATLFWPAASLDEPDMGADYMLFSAASDAPSAQHVLALQPADGWEDLPPSQGPLFEGVLNIAGREGAVASAWHVLAVEDTDNMTGTHQVLFLDDDKKLGNGYTEVRLGKCAGITVSPRLHSGSYVCFTASQGLTVTLYQSRPWYNRGRPADLLRKVNEQFGSPPPEPDLAALRAGWLSAQQYLAMAELRSRWLADVVGYLYGTYAPDLLLTSDDIIAACARAFLLVDGRQEGYGPEKAESYSIYLQRAHGIADANLKKLLTLVNLADSAVFVLSPYGSMPVHTIVHLNTILLNAKLLQTEAGVGPKHIDASKTKAWAVTSGGHAQIYINLQGRERPGLVGPGDYAKVQDQIVKLLHDTKDEAGQPVFARIVKAEELESLHLRGPSTGEVFVQAAPGYLLSDELGVKQVLAPAPCCASDGFSATFSEMRGIFVAAGSSLASGQTVAPVSVLDIAPTIAQALGIQPAPSVQGRVIEGIWR